MRRKGWAVFGKLFQGVYSFLWVYFDLGRFLRFRCILQGQRFGLVI